MKLAMGLQRIDGDEATIAKTLRIFGSQRMAEHSSALASRGSYTARDLKRSLEREARRAYRARKSADRRERHADRVLYRGLVRLGTQYLEQGLYRQCDWSARVVRSRDNRHRLALTTTQDARVVTSRDAEGILLPAGSRVLADFRRGWPDVMVCEVVETPAGKRRLHLWSLAKQVEDTDEIPDLGHIA